MVEAGFFFSRLNRRPAGLYHSKPGYSRKATRSRIKS